MSQNMRTHADMLKVLAKCNPQLRKAIINHGGPQLIRCFCESSLNILKGNVSLSADQKRKLSRHKHKLRTLANPKVSNTRKKKLLVQQGGLVSALLGPVIATLAGLLLK